MGLCKYLTHLYKSAKQPVKYYRSLGMKIGEGCEIFATAQFGSEPYLITLGNHVRVTDNVKFVTHDGGLWVARDLNKEYADADKFGKITVGDNVHIGPNTIIMPGVNIGSNCIIGCGAVVTRDIPNNSVAVGVPAKVIKTVDEYIAKNKDSFTHTKNMTPQQKREYLNKNLR